MSRTWLGHDFEKDAGEFGKGEPRRMIACSTTPGGMRCCAVGAASKEDPVFAVEAPDPERRTGEGAERSKDGDEAIQ
ncbi:MAG TPA: hypothetical protein VGL65_10705 [Gemmatimonadales bacterium]